MIRNVITVALVGVLGTVASAVNAATDNPRKNSEARTTEKRALVRYRTQKRVYIDRGTNAGLQSGERLGGKKQACEVETLSANFASCTGSKAAVGSALKFAPKPAKEAPSVQTNSIKTQASKRLLATARSRLKEDPIALVEFSGSSSLRHSMSARSTLRMFDSGASTGVSWQGGSMTLTLHDTEFLDPRLRVSGDVVAFRWFARPEDPRFLPEQDSQFFVYGLSARYAGDSVTARVGRFRPELAPGLLLIDGVQLGIGGLSLFDEIGVIAGGMPDLISIDRSISRWTAGLYYRISTQRGRFRVSHTNRVATLSARSGALTTETQPRVELSLDDVVDLTGELRLGLESGGLRSARAGAWLPLGNNVTVRGNYRYYGREAVLLDGYGPLGLLPGATSHLDGSFQWQPSGWLITRLQTVYARDHSFENRRLLVGPEIELPSAFAGLGGLAWGYREEFGWLSGRSVYVQTILRPQESLSLISRVSYFADRYDQGLAETTFHELGLFANARWAFAERFALNGTFMTRSGANSVLGAGLSSDRLGLQGRLSLTGSF